MLQCIDLQTTYDPSTIEEYLSIIAKDEAGRIIRVDVTDIPHSLYVAIDPETADSLDTLMTQLNDHLIRRPHPCRTPGCSCPGGSATYDVREPCQLTRREIQSAIRTYEIVDRFGYSIYEEHKRPFLRIEFTYAFFAKPAKEWIQVRGGAFGAVSPEESGVYHFIPETLDSFLALHQIAGFDWFKITGPIRHVSPGHVRVGFPDLVPVPPATVPNSGRRFTIINVDIETSARKYINSESNRSLYPVAMIGCSVRRPGAPAVRKVFTFGRPVAGCETYDTEREMFIAFHHFFLESDPDYVIGYNSNSYDWPYLVRRARLLKYPEFTQISRLPEYEFTYRFVQTRSKQRGTRLQPILTCPGRIFVDILPLAKLETGLNNYRMGTVAAHYGLAAKNELPYTQIFDHFNGTDDQRRILAEYCAQDVEVCDQIEQKNDFCRRVQAKCRILRLRAKEAQERGNGYCLMMILRQKLKKEGYVNKPVEFVYDEKTRERVNVADAALMSVDGYEELWDLKMDDEKYDGAHVFDPETGLENDAVITYDFSGLYPNLIREKNICRSTLLPNIRTHPPDECHISPTGFAFTKRKRGILPQIEDELLAARAAVNALLKEETDPDIRSMLDAEQKQIKIAANSLYGILGSIVTEVSHLAAAQSITSWGALLIQLVAEGVMARFGLRKKYGDTDSIMMAIPGCRDIHEARRIGFEVADWINRLSGLVSGMLRMEFEDISMPTIFLRKKMYVKVVYSPTGPPRAPYLKKRGVDTRAFVAYTREVVDQVMTRRLIQGEPIPSVEAFIRERIQDLYLGRVPLEKIIRSSHLSKPVDEYENDSEQTYVAKQMMHDDLRVEAGDRVEFYMCNVQVQGEKKSQYAVSSHLEGYPILWSYYVEQLVNTLGKLIYPLIQTSMITIANPKTYARSETTPVPRPPMSTGTGATGTVPFWTRTSRTRAPPAPRIIPAVQQLWIGGAGAPSQAPPATRKTLANRKREEKKKNQKITSFFGL